MLVHVFQTLASADEDGIFSRFFEKASKWKGCSAWRQGHVYVVAGPHEDDDEVPEQVEWPSGMLYQKLEGVHSKVSLPVLWRLCCYYDTAMESSEVVRTYLKKRGVETEGIPFFLIPDKGTLQTRCKLVGDPPEISSKNIQIAVDKSDLTVILLPHRGLVRVLLRRLEEVAL